MVLKQYLNRCYLEKIQAKCYIGQGSQGQEILMLLFAKY